MEEIKERYITENMALEDKIASYSALRYIEPTAQKLGFVKQKVRWLNK